MFPHFRHDQSSALQKGSKFHNVVSQSAPKNSHLNRPRLFFAAAWPISMVFFESSSFGLAVSHRLQWSRRAKFKFPQLSGEKFDVNKRRKSLTHPYLRIVRASPVTGVPAKRLRRRWRRFLARARHGSEKGFNNKSILQKSLLWVWWVSDLRQWCRFGKDGHHFGGPSSRTISPHNKRETLRSNNFQTRGSKKSQVKLIKQKGDRTFGDKEPSRVSFSQHPKVLQRSFSFSSTTLSKQWWTNR